MDPIELYTYSTSQSSEKIRWALDATRIPYREHRLTPFVNSRLGASATGGLLSPVPVLVAEGETIADSTRILEWLEARRAPFALIPRDAEARAAVMGAEARFDLAGAHLLRWTYRTLLQHKDLALSLWSLDASPAQRITLRAGYPLVRRVFERGLGFDGASFERSGRMIDHFVAELDRAAESGRTFLVGNSFSVADVTAAALLAPLACPDEHPVYSREDYKAAMEPCLCAWQRRPGLAWVRSLYREYRGMAVQAVSRKDFETVPLARAQAVPS